ncbi:MAG: hypothetical protein KDD43_08715 [Bdellovibrionales bacterium]|nr:hypothetical protein [Bdellovibrionales bacterium]
MKLKLIASIIVGLSTLSASAFSIDTNLFYLSDALSVTSDTTATKMFLDVSINLDLSKKGDFTIGWGYSIISIGDEAGGTETTFGLTEMGPRFGYYIDKERLWGLFLTYNLQATADYKAGGTEVEWRGSSLKAEIGYRPELTENLLAGMHLIYYSASFSEQLSGSTTFTLVSNSRSIIYPAFTLSYRFD